MNMECIVHEYAQCTHRVCIPSLLRTYSVIDPSPFCVLAVAQVETEGSQLYLMREHALRPVPCVCYVYT